MIENTLRNVSEPLRQRNNDCPSSRGARFGSAQGTRVRSHKPEVHIFSGGGHGFGTKKRGTSSGYWIDAFYYWLESQSLTARAQK